MMYFLNSKEIKDPVNMFRGLYFIELESYIKLYSRRVIWEEHRKYIAKHNHGYEAGLHTFYLGINEYSDMVSGNGLMCLGTSHASEQVQWLLPVSFDLKTLAEFIGIFHL